MQSAAPPVEREKESARFHEQATSGGRERGGGDDVAVRGGERWLSGAEEKKRKTEGCGIRWRGES